LSKDAPELCVDEKGFDRVAFHKDFNEKALQFFNAIIRKPSFAR
jgi:hypothetical protein